MNNRRESSTDDESQTGTVSVLTRWLINPPASNPGLLPLNPFRYWRCFPLFPTLHLIGPPTMIALAVFVHWSFAIATTGWLLFLVRFWIQRYIIADGGDLCPAMIVQVNPCRIAVRADLTFGLDSWPVIKVIDHPLERTRMRTLEVGTRLPVVATYVQYFGLNHWADIDAFAAPCMTDNQSAIDQAKRRIPDEEWQALSRDYAALNQPSQPGLYHLRLEGGCNIPLRLWRYMRSIPLLPILIVLLVVGPLLVGIFYPAWWVWWLSPIGLFLGWAWAESAVMIARYSFPCAGKLIDQNAGRIAIYANLDASGGFYPAIKVVDYPAWLIQLAELKEGDRVAVVASYSNKEPGGTFWNDLAPNLVLELTDDPGEAKRVLARLPAEAWEHLEKGLKQLKQPLAPGLYRLKWPEADLPDDLISSPAQS